MTDERRLRDAYEELLAARAPSGRNSCPAPEALLALAERDGPEDVRLGTLDHVMSCESCRRELDLLRAALAASLQASSDVPSVTPLSSASGGRRNAWRPLAAAAGIVVVVGVGIIARGGSTPSTLRGGDAVVTLNAPERAADGGMVLRWQRVPDAVRYHVEVFAPSGVTIADTIVVDTAVALPPAALVARPDTLRWTVTARRSDGGEVRSTMGRISP
jgi:hypothetical protein